MVETGDFCHRGQRSPWASSTFRDCMIAPVEDKQCKFLYTSINPYRVSNEGLNGLKFSGLPERGLMHEAVDSIEKSISHAQIPFCTTSECHEEERTTQFPIRFDAQASIYQTPPQQKKFAIFDQSRNETRLIYSSCPQDQNLKATQTMHSLWNQQDAPVSLHGAYQFLAGGQHKKTEQGFINPYIPYEEDSGENETVNEGSEMREDTEEINALLYSDNDDDDNLDANFYSENEDDEEVSTGHTPLLGNLDEKDLDEVTDIERSSKRQKTLDGGCNMSYKNKHDGLLVLDTGMGCTIGNKRPRKDKIHDTLKALESIIPGVKGKNPLLILDEAISYLKRMKSDAETLSLEDDSDGSSCYGPSN